MLPISHTTTTMKFPPRCARCNQRPGTEQWAVSGSNTFASNKNAGYSSNPNVRTTTTVTHSIEVPICTVCVSEIQAVAEQEKINAKRDDRKIKLAIGICFAIGAVVGIVFQVFSKSSDFSSVIFLGVCLGSIFAFFGAVAVGFWGLLSGLGKKKKSYKDFVRFEMGFLQFDNQEYQREFNRLNSIPDILTSLGKR